MNFSAPFIQRPIATTLLTAAIALAGIVAFKELPVSPLPQVDFPTISVSASLPGASPEIMASSVSTPLEREFGRIAAVTEMTAQSTLGQTSITLQFDLSRNIDAAARDVEAAINAARSYLPANLPNNPTYRKVNPADAPIMIVALTSDKLTPAQLYDAASTILQQRLSQISGVGQVLVGGSSAPAVRINVNPTQLNSYGLQLEDVRSAIAAQTANEAKGSFSSASRRWEITANDQLLKAADYRQLIVAYRGGSPVKLSDVAQVQDSVQTVRSMGLANGKRAALIIIFRQPGANIISTVDGINAALPQLHASINPAIDLTVALDQTVTIRASVKDIERTLLISIVLVVLVVFLFLREWRSTLIPLVAVPVSIIGTLAVMYLAGYSIDNLYGAYDFHRVRGGRCDRGAGEHHALSGRRNGGRGSCVQRSCRNRFYGSFNEPLPGGRVHPDPAHGRYHRAIVPRICDCAFRHDTRLISRVPHDDSHDVRAVVGQ
jgi:multidrug efflux pump